ncbi:MAG: response regulator transcription factor [Actinobacteria bacterium]|nr:response regulator transcription factor [Actinomycetota bacterium]MBV8396170.1 response regulator transcription factor [Actinomycetota bacterium]MBV8598769.1 response regulator transcription factor [Actinomycetota bacterium]
MIRCVVADDHPALVRALSEFLDDEGYPVVGTARSGPEALERIRELEPDVAIVDLRMPRLSGIEVAREVSRARLATGVIIYTGFAEQAQLVEAVDVGARGFVLKEAPLLDLVRAIETVADGRTYVDAVLAGSVARGATVHKLTELTQRERQVLRALADGKSYDEIARDLFISPETVRTHVQKAMNRLDASTRTQAVANALRQALIA